jgi:hypothetical protein
VSPSKAPPPATRAFFLGLALFLAVLGAFRLVFLAVNRATFSGERAGELAFAFLNGVRFDLHVALAILGIPFLLLHLPGLARPRGRIAAFLAWLPMALFLPACILWLADLHYYRDAGRHLSYELLRVGGDSVDRAASLKMLSSYGWTFFVFVLLAVPLLLAWGRIVRGACGGGARGGKAGDGGWWEADRRARWLWLPLYLLVLVFGLKGTLAGKPLRMSDAFVQGRTELGHLTLNPLFTVGRSAFAAEEGPRRLLPEAEATIAVRAMLAGPRTEWLSDDAPLYRKDARSVAFARSGGGERLNLVILMLESWSTRYLGAYGDRRGITPGFDALAKDGLLFTDFYAVGNRTIEGLAAACLGIPSFNHAGDMTRGSFLSGALEQNRYRGLGAILNGSGYDTVYLHGESSGSFRQAGVARLAGFSRHLGREELGITDDQTDGVWGGWDHVVLDRLAAAAGSAREPFFTLCMTLTNHSPFRLPPGEPRSASPGDDEGAFTDTLRYTERSLARFFERVRGEPWFGRTIFVITADHSARSIATMRERYHIPLLVYAPGIVAPGVDGRTGSQLDLLPTALDLLGIGAPHHAMGRSLFDGAGSRFAFLNFSQGYGWIEDGALLEAGPDGEAAGVYDLASGAQRPADFGRLRRELLCYLQVGSALLAGNRFAP